MVCKASATTEGGKEYLSSESKLSFSFLVFLLPASLLKPSAMQGKLTEMHFHQQSLPFYVHHKNIMRSQHKGICEKTVSTVTYTEMFLAPYPAIRNLQFKALAYLRRSKGSCSQHTSGGVPLACVAPFLTPGQAGYRER